MTIDVYSGRKATKQQQIAMQNINFIDYLESQSVVFNMVL